MYAGSRVHKAPAKDLPIIYGMDRLPLELLVPIWKDAYALEQQGARNGYRSWILKSLFQSRTTIGVGRILLYASVFLDSVDQLLSLHETLRIRPDLALLCKKLTFCPPIATHDLEFPSIQYIEGFSDDGSLRWTNFGSPKVRVLPTSALVDLFKLLTNLKSLTMGGVSWHPVQTALQSAGFIRSLKSLHLHFVFVPASALPLLANNTITAFDLEELNVQEMSCRTTKCTGWLAHRLNELASQQPSPLIGDTGDKTHFQDENSLQSLKSYALGKRGWLGQCGDMELTMIESKWRTLRTLALTIPVSEVEALSGRGLAGLLPLLTRLHLKLDSDDQGQFRAEHLQNLLRVTVNLKTFSLQCHFIAASLWEALPSTLQHLKLQGSRIENFSPLLMSLASLPQAIESAPPHLKTFTYNPHPQKIYDKTNKIFETGRLNESVDDELKMYSKQFATLYRVCKARGIVVECDFRWKLQKIVGELWELKKMSRYGF